MSENATQPIDLFSAYTLGPLHLRNRIVMAPLTRSRAEADNVPSSMATTYYSQRASAGLIITEATQTSAGAQGYVSTPGIHSQEQIDRWKQVTDAVHQKGGLIFLQLWHVGRISHPVFRNGELPVAPSAIGPRGVQTYTAEGFQDIPTPRALEISEIPEIVDDFRKAAANARAAGFDGVEIHGANGYLLDQFLEDGTNHRTDEYGGSVENRARLLLEVIDAVVGTFNDMCDSHPQQTFGYVVRRLAALNLGYLHLVDAAPPQGEHPMPDLSARYFRSLYPGTLIVAGGYTLERGNKALQEGVADLIAFGQLFIANPDLVERFRRNAAFNPPDTSSFYGGTEKGYIDYPTLDEVKERARTSR
jgi:N-ethylmaleimide reductase